MDRVCAKGLLRDGISVTRRSWKFKDPGKHLKPCAEVLKSTLGNGNPGTCTATLVVDGEESPFNPSYEDLAATDWVSYKSNVLLD